MLTSDHPTPEVCSLRTARAGVAEAQRLLRTPPIVRGLETCAGTLESAAQSLRDALQAATPGADPGFRGEAEALAREVGRLNALLGRALGFHADWARVLSGHGQAYDRRGQGPAVAPHPRLICEG